MAAIKSKEKRIEYYDSLYNKKDVVLNNLMNWLKMEHIARKNGPMPNPSEWQLVQVKEIPRQQNGNDCGVFALAFAEILSKGLEVTKSSFFQRDIPYFRQQIKYDILRLWKTNAFQ